MHCRKEGRTKRATLFAATAHHSKRPQVERDWHNNCCSKVPDRLGETITCVNIIFSPIQASRNHLLGQGDKIDTELKIHTHIEETVFYPTIEEQDELKGMVAEALEEHQQAKIVLNELEGLGADNHDLVPNFND